MRWAAAIVVLFAGCSFRHGTLTGDGSTTSPEASPQDVLSSDAPVLVDDGLLARYFIDEAAAGQGPVQLADSAPNPMPLDLHYTAAMSFADASGHRALRWTLVDDDGRASAPVNGSKISTQLDPSHTFTLELVIDLRDAGAGGEVRLISVANGVGSYGAITLVTNDLVSLNFHLGTATISWSVPFAQGRLVLHTVVDTDVATAGNRVLLYVDGALATRTSGSSPTLGYDPPILLSDYLTLGNVEGAGRSPAGDLFYAAIYTTALTPEQVVHNTQLLTATDDR